MHAKIAAQDEEFSQDEFSQNKDAENDPILLFNQGQDAHAKGDLKKALEFYERALKEYPAFPEAEYQRGMVFQSLDQHSNAEKSFRKAIELKHNWSLPYIQLGIMLFDTGNYRDSEKFLTEGLRLDGTSYIAISALSDLLVKTKVPDSRLRDFYAKLAVLAKGKNVPISLWTSKAGIERKLGEIDSAKESISRALSLDANDKIALAELAEIYLLERKHDSAIETAERILRKNSESRMAKMILARAYNLKGDSDKALKILDSIPNADQEILEFQTAIKTDGDLTVESLEKMLEIDATNVSALGRLCSVTRATAPEKALDYCKRALTIDKNNINYAIGFGAALVQLKQYSSAVTVLRNLLQHSPNDYVIHANLATALFQMQDFEAAKIEYKWLIGKRSELAVAYYFLAISHDKLLEYKDALENYQKFVELAESGGNQLEVEKVNLRIPILMGQIKRGIGKTKK